MNVTNQESFKKLADALAFNMVASSLPLDGKDAAFNEIFINPDELLNARLNSRNIMIIGAGASSSLSSAIPLANKFPKKLEVAFEERYGEFYTELVKEELGRLTNVYKLSEAEFETQLAAYSSLNKKLVLKTLEKSYNQRFPVSLFYEVVAHLFKHRFIDIIINFNFDEMLDNPIEEELHANEYRFIYSDGHCPENPEVDPELGQQPWLKKPTYIKPHGTISHTTSLKFTRLDYYQIPERIKQTINRLLQPKENKNDPENYELTINLIVVGFGMGSIELNVIIKQALVTGKNVNLYYFDKYDDSNKKEFFAGLDPNLTEIFREDNSFFFKVYEDRQNNLDDIFLELWKKIQGNFKQPFSPKGISRHVIISKIFNPIAHRIIANKDLLPVYYENRVLLEIGLEICNSVDGVLNIKHVRQGRIGKYLSLARKHKMEEDDGDNYNMKFLFKQFIDLGLKRHREGQNDAWVFNGEDADFKEMCLEIIFRKIKLSRFREHESLDLKKLLYVNTFIESGTEPQRNHFADAISSILRKKDGKFLSIAPRPFETKISSFVELNKFSLLNTDIRWIYNFRKYFYNEDDRKKWDLVLAISESGKVFQEERILEALKGKKIVLICSYSSNPNVSKTVKYNDLLKQSKIPTNNKVLADSFLLDAEGAPILKLLPMKNHNQHILIFCKVDAESNTIVPKHGLYYERREMAKKVSPLLIEGAENGKPTDDLLSLKSIFLGYYSRAQKEDNALKVNESIQALTKYFKTNNKIDKSHALIEGFPKTTLRTRESEIEKYLVERFLDTSDE
jgi:hypothetical protein